MVAGARAMITVSEATVTGVEVPVPDVELGVEVLGTTDPEVEVEVAEPLAGKTVTSQQVV